MPLGSIPSTTEKRKKVEFLTPKRHESNSPWLHLFLRLSDLISQQFVPVSLPLICSSAVTPPPPQQVPTHLGKARLANILLAATEDV